MHLSISETPSSLNRGLTRKPRACVIGDPPMIDLAFGPYRKNLSEACDLKPVELTRAAIPSHLALLEDIEVVFGTWSLPVFDEKLLMAMPRLKAIFYAAGSVKYFCTEAMWNRGIRVSASTAANAIPVAEYSVGAILLSLKGFWRFAQKSREGISDPHNPARPVAGGFGSVVGLISLGTIGRKVLELLAPYELKLQVYDPTFTPDEIRSFGAKPVTLDELIATSDVISLHAPLLPETRHMLRGKHFAAMKPGVSFVNSARGALVHEAEMIEVLNKRPDLVAILDVAESEPPSPDSDLFRLPNVIYTPHIAGSMDREIARMGLWMLKDFTRYCEGRSLCNEYNRQQVKRMA